MASEILGPFYIISKQDATEFIESNPNPERERPLRREEFLLVAQRLGIGIVSSNVFLLANLVCHHLCGTDVYDFVDEEENISAISESSSRGDV